MMVLRMVPTKGDRSNSRFRRSRMSSTSCGSSRYRYGGMGGWESSSTRGKLSFLVSPLRYRLNSPCLRNASAIPGRSPDIRPAASGLYGMPGMGRAYRRL
jgi:hypothetical protein